MTTYDQHMYVLPACWYDLKLFQSPELGNPSCPVIAEPATTCVAQRCSSDMFGSVALIVCTWPAPRSQASAIRYTSAQEFVSSKVLKGCIHNYSQLLACQCLPGLVQTSTRAWNHKGSVCFLDQASAYRAVPPAMAAEEPHHR